MVRKILMLLLVGLASLMAMGAAAQSGGSQSVESCLECHGEDISGQDYLHSVHGRNGCASCHADLTDLERHSDGELIPGPVDCASCHRQVVEEHATSVHGENGVDCTQCHSEIHRQQKLSGSKAAVIEKCSECHDTEDYVASVHGQGVAAGNAEAPTCSDCHGLHSVKALSGADPHEARAFHTEACMDCHGDEEMMERNGVAPLAVETFIDSYHGKSYRLGFPEHAAGCADCHGGHGVRSEEDELSTVNMANRAQTCGQCHDGATTLFAKFYSHGDHADRENYPLLYWTFMGMTALLVGTFAFFWIHTLLWMFRGFVDNRQMQRALHEGRVEHIPEAHKRYLRFQKRHIFLHLVVIISFLGLSLTGLPLKFSDQEWAKTMMSFYGGVKYAGLIHRGCAILTFYYFLGAILMAIDFLFIRKDVKGGFFARLFGPDSLMPNFRDVRDIRDMFRWFFFRGPKPTFERWTYWEKFDFLAVFWGMFAIGGSGLLLWFPEFFGSFLPGWMFNISTIVHSDEALLATGFIFTVHFFNTHGRPEKFPMDFVIFNGEITKEEMIWERGDQWRRYEEEGITEQFVAPKTSGVLYDFFFKGFGFGAFFTGLSLAFLMVMAFIKG